MEHGADAEMAENLSPEQLILLQMRLRINEANVKLALVYARELAAAHLPQPRIKELEDEYENEIREIQEAIDRAMAALK